MKHDLRVTFLLLGMFLLAQVIGLGITQSYYNPVESAETGQIVFEDLPFNFERPEPQGASGIGYLFVAVLIGTLVMLGLIKYNVRWVIKLWFLFAIALTSVFALAAFVDPRAAAFVGVGLAVWRIYRPNIIVQNLTEVFLYGGLAAIFVPFISTVLYASIILILISLYDAYAVWKSKHMVKLAEYQSSSGVFAGLLIPYGRTRTEKKASSTKKQSKKKNKAKKAKSASTRSLKAEKSVGKEQHPVGRTAVLGGGDIGFPLLFAGVVLTQSGFFHALLVSLGATIALAFLLWYGKENRYYPAMPFLSVGCFLGYALTLLL